MTASVSASPSKAATPLMQQYLGIKGRYPEEILFFRLGDFYEMFFEDAVRAAPILEVALTQRQSVPMCGVPYHAMTSYLSKLIKAGLSVAIAEQLEDPKKTKAMVKRDVVRVVTPGTLVEDELLPAKSNNFLVAIAAMGASKGSSNRWALCATDVSTGRQWTGEMENDFHWNTLKSHLASLAPSEILLVGEAARALSSVNTGRAVVRFEPSFVPTATGASGGKPFEASEGSAVGQAIGAIRRYLERDHAEAIKSLRAPVPLDDGYYAGTVPASSKSLSGTEPLPMASTKTLFLDETAIRHLELVVSSDPFKTGPTLLSLLDQCVTPLGSRLLRWWLLHPSMELPVIQARLNRVQELVENSILRAELCRLLKQVADIERISVRTQAGTVSPRDLEALRQSLQILPTIQNRLATSSVFDASSDLSVPDGILEILTSQLADEPPAKLVDGGVIKEGFNTELDELRRLRRSGKKWIAEMENKERGRTSIGSLKVGYNDIFGYYIEVSKSNLPKVPADWIRKQTMANGERFITPALKEQEEKILGAEEKIRSLEAMLYAELVHQVAAFGPSLAKISEAVAQVDAVAALAEAAVQNGFLRPRVVDSNELIVKGGRHPIVEKQIGRDRFIPNDVTLEAQGNRIAVITGPNMAGKSTYLRQNALLVIMAQMGSFVPADSAVVGIVDKIFTRIGASDRLAQGQSTFMVEMQEVATLLQNATERSLLILDEVGRGTSTYDGVSIAWAVVEYLSGRTPRTLFATHYFELTQLEGPLPRVFNAHATAKEWPGPDGKRQVVFLYQILPGAADRSYGIHVAEMAGLPDRCIERAREILKQLESGGHGLSKGTAAPSDQLELFETHPVLEELKSLHVESMTPIEALNKLSELKEKL